MTKTPKLILLVSALALSPLFSADASAARRSSTAQKSNASCDNTKEPMRTACLAAQKRGVRIVSCYRSPAHQARLRAYFCSIGRCGQAAPPGRSLHQQGLACDLGSNLGQSYTPVRGATVHRLNSRSHSGNHYSKTGR